MLTDRFKALEKIIEQLPPEVQNALADALEGPLSRVTRVPSPLASDVRAAIDRALAQHAATLRYLKDK